MGCKRQEIVPVEERYDKQRSACALEEKTLFQIKEDGRALLYVKSRLGAISIENECPNTSLGKGNTYKIVDNYGEALGKAYEFTSSTVFTRCVQTDLFGLIKIYKNGKLIFEEKYDFSV